VLFEGTAHRTDGRAGGEAGQRASPAPRERPLIRLERPLETVHAGAMPIFPSFRLEGRVGDAGTCLPRGVERRYRSGIPGPAGLRPSAQSGVLEHLTLDRVDSAWYGTPRRSSITPLAGTVRERSTPAERLLSFATLLHSRSPPLLPPLSSEQAGHSLNQASKERAGLHPGTYVCRFEAAPGSPLRSPVEKVTSPRIGLLCLREHPRAAGWGCGWS